MLLECDVVAGRAEMTTLIIGPAVASAEAGDIGAIWAAILT
jgi:hypothetical protein